MNIRSTFSVPATLAGLLFLTSCGESSADPPAGGSGPGGAATGGAGTSTTAGAGAGGVSGGAAGGQATAGGGSGAGGGGTSGAGGGGTSGAGGGGTAGAAGGGAGGPPATFATLTTLIKSSCYGSPCHDLVEHNLPLIVDDGLYMRLLNHTTMKCGPTLTPGDPSQSAIVKLLKADCNGTVRMPYFKCFDGDGDENELCVPSATIAALEQWIKNGAPPQ